MFSCYSDTFCMEVYDLCFLNFEWNKDSMWLIKSLAIFDYGYTYASISSK